MTLERSRHVDALQRMLTSIKHFEKKLDKLQNDLNSQGQTLSDLREMMQNLSSGNITDPDANTDDVIKNTQGKSTAIQYNSLHSNTKIGKKKATIPPPPSKLKVQSFLSEKPKLQSPLDSPFPTHLYKMDSSHTHTIQKHRKLYNNRKNNNLKTQKKFSEKKTVIMGI